MGGLALITALLHPETVSQSSSRPSLHNLCDGLEGEDGEI